MSAMNFEDPKAHVHIKFVSPFDEMPWVVNACSGVLNLLECKPFVVVNFWYEWNLSKQRRKNVAPASSANEVA